MKKPSRKEVWKDIRGYKGRYMISNKGRVKSLKRLADPIFVNNARIVMKVKQRIMKTALSMGYPVVSLNKLGIEKQVSVHRLVAQAFIPNPLNLPQVNHRDGNKKNNYYKNLQWVTNRQNIQHAFDNGLIKASRGEDHYNTSLKIKDVKRIRRLHEKGIHAKEIASEYGMTIGGVRQIAYRLRWKHI